MTNSEIEGVRDTFLHSRIIVVHVEHAFLKDQKSVVRGEVLGKGMWFFSSFLVNVIVFKNRFLSSRMLICICINSITS